MGAALSTIQSLMKKDSPRGPGEPGGAIAAAGQQGQGAGPKRASGPWFVSGMSPKAHVVDRVPNTARFRGRACGQ